MYKRILYVTIHLCVGVFACTPSRVIRPLAAKEVVVGATFGGPIIDFAGAKIPVPFSSVYGAYGLDSSRSVFGGFHTTSIAAGVAQVDIGLTQSILYKKGWGLSASPVVNFMYGYKSFRLYPQLDINAYREYGVKKHFAYVSLSNWFVPYAKRAHDVKQSPHYIPNFVIGNTFNRAKMNYNIEMRWLAPFNNNQMVVPDFNGIGKQGSLGVYFGVAKRF